MHQHIKILSTKILTIQQEQLLNGSMDIFASDFIQIELNDLEHRIVEFPIENMLITSKNTVVSLLKNFSVDALQCPNIFCVGSKTKSLIEKKIGKVLHMEERSESMAYYLADNLNDGAITFFCGNIRRKFLPSMLRQRNIKINEIETYKTLLKPIIVDDDFEAILFFSPSAIKSYLKANEANDAIAFCIGKTTADEAMKSFSVVKIAEEPTVEHVIALVNFYFEIQIA